MCLVLEILNVEISIRCKKINFQQAVPFRPSVFVKQKPHWNSNNSGSIRRQLDAFLDGFYDVIIYLFI